MTKEKNEISLFQVIFLHPVLLLQLLTIQINTHCQQMLDTAVTVFQEKPDKPLQKPFKSEVRLRNMIILKRLSCQG